MSRKRIVFPEPLHRLCPTSGGCSVRELPRPSLDSIRKSCEHYERKCSGKYDHSKRAGRYLYDLSREVQAEVNWLELHYNDELVDHKRRLAVLERTLKEWNEAFNGDPQAHSPHELKERMANDQKRIRDLKKRVQGCSSDLAQTKQGYEKRLTEFMISARRQLQHSNRTLIRRWADDVHRERQHCQEVLRELRDTYISAISEFGVNAAAGASERPERVPAEEEADAVREPERVQQGSAAAEESYVDDPQDEDREFARQACRECLDALSGHQKRLARSLQQWQS